MSLSHAYSKGSTDGSTSLPNDGQLIDFTQALVAGDKACVVMQRRGGNQAIGRVAVPKG
jgi:hypothetical protein